MIGTSESDALEVLSVVIPSFLLVFIATTSYAIFLNFIGSSFIRRFILEFGIVVVPIIVNITVLVPYMFEMIGLLLFVCINLTFLATYYVESEKKTTPKPSSAYRNFITNARATINLITAIAILAVDFKIFPRQFRKKLKYGYSLMDIGVGLFVFANAIVAPEIRGQTNSLVKTFKDTIPLLVIGIGRYLATLLTHYSVSVTEYGVHWNFFITLAVTRIISSLILNFVNVKFSLFTGVILLFVHECILQLGLADYVISDAARDNFFSANREGITSSLGFVALYFLSVSFGVFINIKEKQITSKQMLVLKIITYVIILVPLTFYLEFNFNISRRLANSAYCLWTLSVGVLMCGLFYSSELIQEFIYKKYKVSDHFHVPLILDAINYNGLFYFLVANVLTGIVNMSIETLLVGPKCTFFILITYMCLTCIAVCILFTKNIRLKL